MTAPENNPAIESAREALRGGWFSERYPWYDSATDDVRRINVKTPKQWDWSWWTNFWDWVGSFNFNFNFNFLGIPFDFSLLQLVAWIGLAILAVGLIYLLTRIYYKREAQAAGRAHEAALEKIADSADRVEALPLEVRRHAGTLLEEARRHYEAGNYAEAIVYLFSHQLWQLDKRHLIRLALGKTNRQYLREITSMTPLARLIEATMLAFEDVFFGQRAIDRARFESCWSRLDEFDRLTQADTRSGVPA